jgi:tRNA dimethylallyltransferase
VAASPLSTDTQEPSAIFVLGPTAAGKTGIAVQLVEQFPLEIISVDSALVYRGMDIGTAKPDAAILRRAPHRLIDIRDPAQAYSAAEFCADALQAMTAIRAAGRIPLLVGGTMLYFRALQRGLSPLPQAQPHIRQQLYDRLAIEGLPALHAELQSIDPHSAQRIHRNDPQRTLRALEVFMATGQTMSAIIAQNQGSRLPYRLLKLALLPQDRAFLHQRIEARFRQMLQVGFVDEVEQLRRRGDLHADMPSMRTVGYRQIWSYLEGAYDYDVMLQRGVIATRQLAKRQLTWLRAEFELETFDCENPDMRRLSEVVGGFLDQR